MTQHTICLCMFFEIYGVPSRLPHGPEHVATLTHIFGIALDVLMGVCNCFHIGSFVGTN